MPEPVAMTGLVLSGVPLAIEAFDRLAASSERSFRTAFVDAAVDANPDLGGIRDLWTARKLSDWDNVTDLLSSVDAKSEPPAVVGVPTSPWASQQHGRLLGRFSARSRQHEDLIRASTRSWTDEFCDVLVDGLAKLFDGSDSEDVEKMELRGSWTTIMGFWPGNSRDWAERFSRSLRARMLRHAALAEVVVALDQEDRQRVARIAAMETIGLRTDLTLFRLGLGALLAGELGLGVAFLTHIT